MEYRKLYEGPLFHFCANQFLPGIRKKGLRFGKIPFGTMENIQLINGYQWLTTNAAFLQTWNQYSTLPYDSMKVSVSIKCICGGSVHFDEREIAGFDDAKEELKGDTASCRKCKKDYILDTFDGDLVVKFKQ